MSYNNGSLPFPQPPSSSSSSFSGHQQQQYYQSNSDTTTNAGGQQQQQQQQQPQKSNSIDYTQRLPQLSWPNIHHEQRQSAPSTSQQQHQPPSSRSQLITESPADSGAGSDAEDLPQSATTNNAYPRNNGPTKRKSGTTDPTMNGGNGSESGERGGSNSKKKRNRAVLSCAPCKARKIKCDRNLPCTSCVKRGLSEQCHWEDISKTGVPQPFATVSEVDDLRARLESVESILARVPQNLLEAVADIKAESDLDGENSNDGEEAAVGALESLALGHHHQHIKGRGAPHYHHDANIHYGSPNLKVGDSAASGIRPPYNPVQVVQGLQNTTRKESTIFLPIPLSMSIVPVTEFLRDLLPSSVIRHVMKALPRKEVSDALMSFYWNNCDWMDTTVSEKDFIREMNDFWNHLDNGRPVEAVDPAWLAVFFMKLAVAARQMPTAYLSREDPAIVAILPDQFYMAAKRCLELADWTIRPQFRVLQCLAGLVNYVWFSANRNEGLVTLAAAMRLAQVLGLGTLGDDQKTMPPWEDLAFPSGPSVLKRQLSCRVWAHFCFLDNTFSSLKSMTVFHPIRGATTVPPLNLNDDDLHTSDLVAKDRPINEYTDMTYFLMRNDLVGIWRFIDSDTKHTYDDILAMDKQIRKIIGRMPKSDAEGNILGSRTKRKNASAQEAVIQSGLSAQLVRLHNPYWFRSFKNPTKYAYAHEMCLSAAASVLDSNLQAIRLQPGERFWFLHLHTFSATMCLLLDLMHSIDSDAPNAKLITEERLKQAEQAVEIFQHTKQTSRVATCQRIGRMGEAIVNATVKAAKDRRAHRAAGDARANESYADTFKRIMAVITSDPNMDESRSHPKPNSSKASNSNSNNSGIQPHHTLQNGSIAGSGHYTINPPQPSTAPFAMPLPPVDTSAQDVLQSLGISLDQLVRQSPTSSSSSNQGQQPVALQAGQNSALPWAPDSVFDDLFGSSDFFGGQDLWTTGNF